MSTLTTCPSCGADIASDTARWCGSCGASLGRSRPDTDGAHALELLDDAPTSGVEEQLPRTGQRVAVGLVVAMVVALLAIQGGGTETVEETGFADRGDPARSGVVSAVELGAPTEVLWRASLDAGVAERPRQAGLGSEVLVVGSADGVTAHRRADARVLWHRPDLEPASRPMVVDDIVVVPDRRMRQLVGRPLRADRVTLVALSADRGDFRWNSPVEFGSAELLPHPRGVLVIDGTREVRLLDSTIGAPLWNLDGLQGLDASIRGAYISGDPDTVHLLVTRPAGIDPRSSPAELVTEHLVAVDAATGEIRYEVTTQTETLAPDPFDVADGIAAGVDHRRLWLWDAASGERTAVAEHHLTVPPVAVTVASEAIVVMDVSGVIAGFHPTSGERLWGLPGGPGDSATLTVSGDSVLAIDGRRILALNPTTGSLRSTFDLPGSGGADPAPPVIDPAGGVLVAASDGRIHLLDETGGRLLGAPTLERAWPVPATRSGLVAVQAPDAVSLFDAEVGGRLWRLASSPERIAAHTLHAPVIAEEQVVVSPPGDGSRVPDAGLAGIDRENAVYAWSRSGDRLPPNGPLTLADDTVFLPVDDEVHGHEVLTGRRSFAARAGHPRGAVALHREYAFAATDPDATAWNESHRRAVPGLIAIRRHDRTTAWVRELPACTAPAVVDDAVLVATFDELVALDVHRGEDLWRRPLGTPGCLDLSVSGGTVVAVEGRQRLVAFDTEVGSDVWHRDLDGTLVAAPTVVGDTLVVALFEGEVVGYSMADGAEAWRFDVGGTPASSVTVDGDRYLVLTREGELVAFGG